MLTAKRVCKYVAAHCLINLTGKNEEHGGSSIKTIISLSVMFQAFATEHSAGISGIHLLLFPDTSTWY